jgi:hypothetical protein
MSADDEFEFSLGEVRALETLRATLRQVAEWPPESPLSFVLSLAPRTRGKLGEMLLKRLAEETGLPTGKAESVAYDLQVGGARCEVTTWSAFLVAHTDWSTGSSRRRDWERSWTKARSRCNTR